jgi:hypothetical protein
MSALDLTLDWGMSMQSTKRKRYSGRYSQVKNSALLLQIQKTLSLMVMISNQMVLKPVTLGPTQNLLRKSKT